MSFGPVIDELIDALRVLPGVGQKSAQRMALHLLERNRNGAQHLSEALSLAMESVGRCQRCCNLSESEVCRICSDTRRDASLLCIVESPSDLLAIEQAHYFNGYYHVLAGSLSPIDGRGPEQVGIPALLNRVIESQIKEIILATNPTVEGEATAHYIAQSLSQHDVLITRLAQGIPLGGELGYVDGGTLGHAFSGRKPMDNKE
ncbi:MAG: recombination protein RecR [Oleiphilus sp.]|nr:MAG: recombination protein RecR [Oleiphilus sp.]